MMNTIEHEQMIGKAQQELSRNIIQEVQECVDFLIAKIQLRQDKSNGDPIPWPLPYIY